MVCESAAEDELRVGSYGFGSRGLGNGEGGGVDGAEAGVAGVGGAEV